MHYPARLVRQSEELPVAKPELGTKRVCPVTGRKFYDLGTDPIVSPYTGISYPLGAFEAPVRGAAPKVAQAATDEEVMADPEREDAELVALEDADAEESSTGAKPVTTTDDVEVEEEEDTAADDTFLEEDEDEDTDVADLIDGDIEEDEEP
jgi:uncharacterized protein (TIGR02300 family)